MLRTFGVSSMRGRPAGVLAVALAGSVLLTLTAPVAVEPAAAARPHQPRHPRPQPTTIRIATGSNRGSVPINQLGVNHRWVGSGHGIWNGTEPTPAAVAGARKAGVQMLRYPGGIVGNLFDWKQSIGPVAQRGCQTNGQLTPAGGYSSGGSATYGPDEFMQFADAVGARPLVMAPFANETPDDAADWVEYMNSPADGSNPNGGVDYADLRARYNPDHPQPYGVRLWEVGNEQRVKKERYWMSQDTPRALHQYINGATVPIVNEAVGRGCQHPIGGVASDGQRGRSFQLLYPPVAERSVTLRGGTNQWVEVPTANDFQTVGFGQSAFAVDENTGEITFGPQAFPESPVVLHADYTSVHEGVFSFISAMKAVDPRIRVCPTWGLKSFIRAARGHRYDCFSAHSYTNFKSARHQHWRNAVQGHDLTMVNIARERAFLAKIKRALPRGVPIALTEFGAIWGDTRAYPHWEASMTYAVYMGSMWVDLLNLGIPWATGSDLVGSGNRGLLGHRPQFTFSAEALTRRALLPMYQADGRRLRVAVARNPVRRTALRGHYHGLAVAATRGRDRNLYVLVVNRLPIARQRVRAVVDLGRASTRRVAFVSRVNGARFSSWNVPGHTQVRLRHTRQHIGRHRFASVFPAHSVTVLRIPLR